MIYSKIDSTRKRVEYGFPRLMISEAVNANSPYFLIVLFDRPGQSMIVAKTEALARHEVGAYRRDFDMRDFDMRDFDMRDFDMGEFVDFSGTIELSNLP